MLPHDIRIELHLLVRPIYVIFTSGYYRRRYQAEVRHVRVVFSFGMSVQLSS